MQILTLPTIANSNLISFNSGYCFVSSYSLVTFLDRHFILSYFIFCTQWFQYLMSRGLNLFVVVSSWMYLTFFFSCIFTFDWISSVEEYEGPGLRTIPSREDLHRPLQQTGHLNKRRLLWLTLSASGFPDPPGRRIKQKPWRCAASLGHTFQGCILPPPSSPVSEAETDRFSRLFPYLAGGFSQPALSLREYAFGEAGFYGNSTDFLHFHRPKT